MNITFKKYMPLLCVLSSLLPAWAGLSSDFEAGREAYSKKNITRVAESAEKLNKHRKPAIASDLGMSADSFPQRARIAAPWRFVSPAFCPFSLT